MIHDEDTPEKIYISKNKKHLHYYHEVYIENNNIPKKNCIEYIQADKVKKMCQDFVDLAEKQFEHDLPECMAEAVEKYAKKYPHDIIQFKIKGLGYMESAEIWVNDKKELRVCKSIEDLVTHILTEGGAKGEKDEERRLY